MRKIELLLGSFCITVTVRENEYKVPSVVHSLGRLGQYRCVTTGATVYENNNVNYLLGIWEGIIY